MPASSVFFEDPDGHSLEYISVLDQTPRPDWGWLPISEWRAHIDHPGLVRRIPVETVRAAS